MGTNKEAAGQTDAVKEIEMKEYSEVTTVVISKGTDLNNYHSISSQLKHFEQYRITESSNIKLPVTIIALNGEAISTEGNITTFSGASKSGKTACTGFLIAGAISEDGNIIDKLEGMDVEPNSERKAVIHIDTEQARHKHQYNLIGLSI